MAFERVVADPESDPSATWAVDPALVRRLTARVVTQGGTPPVTSTAPWTGAPLAELPQSSPDDVAVAVARARTAQRVWAERDVRDRARVLRRLHDLVLEQQSQALDLVQKESGKARIHAFEELADVAFNARWYARVGRRLLATERHAGMIPVLTKVREHHEPWGVVGIVAPWNYPLTLAVSDALPALLAGNAVVLKPDTQTALTALWVAERLAEAGLPEDLFLVVLGDGPVVGSALVDAADFVCFTGSTATGRQVAQRAAARLVPASLELGGKNAAYVAEDADLARAAEGLVRDCFTGAGQLCVSMERLLVHEKVADRFLDLFTDRVRRLRLSAALDFSGDVGSLISRAQLDKVQGHVEDAVASGARVLVGGRPRPEVGPLFFEPTVLEGVTPAARCFGEETFGPVVAVQRVASDAEALAIANDTPYGLNAAVWTKDLRRGSLLARRIEAGSVSVNESYIASWGSVASPIGGHKQSGLGRRHGAAGLLRFTQPKTVAVQRVAGMGLLYGLGSERFARLLTALLRLSKATRFPWP